MRVQSAAEVEPYVPPPGLPPVQDSDRTFADSMFRRCYDETPAPAGPMTLGAALQQLLHSVTDVSFETLPGALIFILLN